MSADNVADNSFSAASHGFWPFMRPELHPPGQHSGPAAAVAEQAAALSGAAPGTPDDAATSLSVSRLPRSLGQGTFAFEAARVEPGEDDVDETARTSRRHVLADRTAVRPHDAVGAQQFLDRVVQQQSTAVVDVAVAAIGVGHRGRASLRAAVDGLRAPDGGHRRGDRH